MTLLDDEYKPVEMFSQVWITGAWVIRVCHNLHELITTIQRTKQQKEKVRYYI